MNIKIVIPVWGDDYINVLKKVVLPSHFSKGNLPFISINCQVEYVFYTLQEDLKHLNDELSKLNLERFAKVCIKTFRKNHRKNIYALYGNAHKKEIKIATRSDTAIFFLNADILLSENFFKKCIEKLSNQIRVVQIACPRANLEKIVNNNLLVKSSFSIPSSELIELWKKNMHPLMKYHILDKSIAENLFHPSSLMWQDSSKNTYLRAFHLHPVLIYPGSRKIKNFGTTIDDGWIFENFLQSEIYVEEKNTEYFSVELSPKSKYYKAAATFDDMKSIYMYFAFNKRANFINLSSEIQIGEFSALELDKISSEANVYLNKMLLGFEFFTSKYPLGTSDALLFQVYLKIVYLIVKFKPIIPLMIYKHLRNIHHYLVKLLFR